MSTEPDTEDIVYRLLKRAEIRRQIPGRKSVQEGKPDRIADLLEEAAEEIKILRGGNRKNLTIGIIVDKSKATIPTKELAPMPFYKKE